MHLKYELIVFSNIFTHLYWIVVLEDTSTQLWNERMFELYDMQVCLVKSLFHSYIWWENLYRLLGKGCKLVGCGSAVPELMISNDDLAKIVDTSDEWISVRTGIRNRRILSGVIFPPCPLLFLCILFPHIRNVFIVVFQLVCTSFYTVVNSFCNTS